MRFPVLFESRKQVWFPLLFNLRKNEEKCSLVDVVSFYLNHWPISCIEFVWDKESSTHPSSRINAGHVVHHTAAPFPWIGLDGHVSGSADEILQLQLVGDAAIRLQLENGHSRAGSVIGLRSADVVKDRLKDYTNTKWNRLQECRRNSQQKPVWIRMTKVNDVIRRCHGCIRIGLLLHVAFVVIGPLRSKSAPLEKRSVNVSRPRASNFISWFVRSPIRPVTSKFYKRMFRENVSKCAAENPQQSQKMPIRHQKCFILHSRTCTLGETALVVCRITLRSSTFSSTIVATCFMSKNHTKTAIKFLIIFTFLKFQKKIQKKNSKEISKKNFKKNFKKKFQKKFQKISKNFKKKFQKKNSKEISKKNFKKNFKKFQKISKNFQKDFKEKFWNNFKMKFQDLYFEKECVLKIE